jgi:uncharacterized repeat protein (TIGR04076 family)
MSDPTTGIFACPDHAVQNVFKLERLSAMDHTKGS